ncbi:MAG: DUF302 domain-containing protein [Arenicellales bacterium]
MPNLAILQFCDAMVGRRMLDFSPKLTIFVPYQITVTEDITGEIWLTTMDWDVNWLAKAWQPGSKLPPYLVEDAERIRDAMTDIDGSGRFRRLVVGLSAAGSADLALFFAA